MKIFIEEYLEYDDEDVDKFLNFIYVQLNPEVLKDRMEFKASVEEAMQKIEDDVDHGKKQQKLYEKVCMIRNLFSKAKI